MEYNELMERFEMGEFSYKNDSYWISQNEEGYFLTRERDSFRSRLNQQESCLLMGRLMIRLFRVVG
ncbi:hypothetical protein [Paenibacillus polymyxa]|uniref:hypothetical protein n=1 Tax=Paenibacillus polymyxa TaxID=1406 RepID=UPI00287F9BF9|nr:hypothetical protein [Paenibacillus polymyxa]